VLKFFQIEKNAALALLVLATAGWILANSPVAESWIALWGSGGEIDWLHLTLADFVAEFLMVGFFLLVGIELKREWVEGLFVDRKSLLRPALAALIGAALPAFVYLWLNGTDSATSAGWAIPMPTDLTFSLAVFAVFGRGWPAAARVFILAFAIIDDLIAVLVIAFSSVGELKAEWLIGFAVAMVFFSILARTQNAPALIAVGLIAWYLLFRSGVQPAIVGAAFGLMLNKRQLHQTERALHIWVAAVILPLFALSATSIPAAGALTLEDPLTLAIALRPLAKIIGILTGVLLAGLLISKDRFTQLGIADYLALAPLGGIGFSVSILIANQAFGHGSPLANQAIIATLLAAIASAALAGLTLRTRAALGGFSKR
jgi:NhaA family Na+:H+ antiporter